MIDFADETTTSCSLVEDGRTRQERLDALDDAIAALSAHLQAATYRLLVLIRAFDAEDGWADQGFASCAAWLSWRTGVGAGAAREKVRVARALAELPVLSAAMERGELSYSMARAITRVATPADEAELVETARHVSAAQMERLIRSWRAADRAEAAELAAEAPRHAARRLRLVAEEDGSWRITGRLDPETGAALQQALTAAEEALYRQENQERAEARDGEADADAEPAVPAAARRADALGRVAEAALGRGLAAEDEQAPDLDRGDRYQVVVHVDAADLAAAKGAAVDVSAETPRIEGGPAIAAATARRLACDASLVGMVRDRRGAVLDVGRRTRAVPAAIRRALAVRDRGCTFPGCGSRLCDAHHVLPWAAGGATSLDNLVLLCRRHHRLVHEEGWTVERRAETGEGDGAARFAFQRPDGRPLPRVPDRPAAPTRPVDALVRGHRERGLTIDARTATPDWDGEEMDVELVLQALRPHPLAGRRNAPFPADGGTAAGTRPGDVSAETPADDGRGADDGDTGGRWRPLRTWGEDEPPDDDHRGGDPPPEGG